MQYAWPPGTTDKSDLSKRIKAEDFRGVTAECPCCDRKVVATCINGVWQWVHARCPTQRPRKNVPLGQ